MSDFSEFRLCPILKIRKGNWTIDSVEISGGLKSEFDATEDDYDEFFRSASAELITGFIGAQIDLAKKLSPLHCWINLPPYAISRNEVAENLTWLVMESDARVEAPPSLYADNVGFEIVERGDLSRISIDFMMYLGESGYLIALDDVGAGLHTNMHVVARLCHIFRPTKIKFDGKFAMELTPDAVANLIIRKCQIFDQSPNIVIEGVDFDVKFNDVNGEKIVLKNRKLQAWKDAVYRIEEFHDIEVGVQVRPVLASSFLT